MTAWQQPFLIFPRKPLWIGVPNSLILGWLTQSWIAPFTRPITSIYWVIPSESREDFVLEFLKERP